MSELAWIDLAILTTMLASLALGAWRGVVSEVLSLAAWVAAFFAAKTWGGDAGTLLGGMLKGLHDGSLRTIVGFMTVFFLTMVIFAIARLLLSGLLRAIGLGLVDRFLGALFGFARGFMIAWLGVLLAGLTDIPRQDWWREARLTPPLETAVVAAKPWLPPSLAQRIHYRTGNGAKT